MRCELRELAAVRGGEAFTILAHAEGLSGADAMIARVLPSLDGLEGFAARMGLAVADAIAFGDAPNDMPMLSCAGLSYAVADGHPTARVAAKREAPAARDDGVARVLEELFELTLSRVTHMGEK